MSARRALEADLPQLLALLAELDDEPPLSMTEALPLWRALESAGGSYYLLEHEGEAVGAFCLLVYPLLVHGGQRQAVVDAVVVRRALRGQGWGKRLMQAAMALAAEAGAGKLALSSNRRRLDAHAFYRALGFAQHGISLVVEPIR